ncbi:DNA mismatch repair endonuclease MutL [Paramaledivibacter caminithermalis]|jgi:DNA mismatch repair protein MutL|uniref:DNA mismatch repair protein MutL n=1 Tax=Paramaledivibacter caminithermalis (strain DSM 15212 / CIP 107654 / DViRD3) TaxID=1121301 RepID=A0A1M6JKU5_PARC5|nr:DNA mismatch repair endonuclease MutL [Paramaledivibacter caminithermalis]SHJ47309.1 DNA mismatch repair protein MutL [Paramaledivibacter caminithermalis DSM 15212]
MINRIRKLDKSVSNKIAAGEVVERPASVVKELLENSIDANSTSVVIEIRDAGKSYIRVSDNGRGIHKEDMYLAFERHATSKIYSDAEIYDIKSLGFRGEALASIASVSNIEIITKTADDEYGIRAELVGGEIISNNSIGCPDGTTIVVKDLFYNTPARHKFLKSNSTEMNYINTIVNNIALSHPEISFRYIVNNKNIFTTQGNDDLYSTIYTIYGKDISKNLIKINHEKEEMKIKGFVSNISCTRGNRQLQIYFVNGRYVKNKVITRAIDEAYGTLMPRNRFPICFLYLDIPSNKVDVNIHPAKTEIRFRDERRISEFILNSIKEKLLSSDLIPNINIGNNPSLEKEKFKYSGWNNEIDQVSEQLSIGIKKEKETVFEKPVYRKNLSMKEDEEIEGYVEVRNDNNIQEGMNKNDNKDSDEEKIGKIFDEIFAPKKQKVLADYQQNEGHRLDGIRIIGQLFSTYIVCEKEEQMFIIDQHAAHERIHYEKFMKDYINSEILSQILLEPIIVELNYIDKNVIMENKNIFKKLGYKIEEFGYNTIILREVPIHFGTPVAKKFFIEIAENLNRDFKNGYELEIEKILQKTCKNSIKASDTLKDIEIEKLIDDLKQLDNSFTCPHGRPIVISISKKEIEKKFLRT